jgi:hypothetical protein
VSGSSDSLEETTATLLRHQRKEKDVLKLYDKSVVDRGSRIADSTRHTTANIKISLTDRQLC